MKVIYFTFLVLFLFVSQSFADCFTSCGCSNGSCPTDTAFLCFTSCRKANTQSTTATTPTSSVSPSSKSAASKSTKSSKSKPPAKENTPSQDNASQQSAAVGSCGSDEYPNGYGGCLKCPGNQTVVVAGKGYCNVDGSAGNNGGDSDSCTVENTSAECIAQRNQACRNVEDLAGGGVMVWSQEEKRCVSQKTTASNTESEQCIQQFVQMNEKCIDEASSAMTSCNDNNEEMQAAENTAKLIGVGSVTSMQVACSKIGDLSKLANGALTGWKALCSTNQGGCTESCTEAKRILQSECIQEPNRSTYISSYLPKINSNINQCESYKEKIAQATQHAAAALAQLKASEQCKNDTSSLVNTAVDQCKANPNSPLCKDLQKCSDANFAAQNPVCACASNPTSSACLQASSNYGSGTSSTGATLPGVNGGKDTSGLPGINSAANGDGQNLNGLGTNAAPATDGHGVGGRQGDASSAGNLKNNAAGGPNAAGNHYAAGTGKDPLKVNSGTLGGMPGGPGYFGRNPSSGGYAGNNAINGNKGTLGKFDPRKYITGLGGKGEYINGANQNIFMIVKMRYEDKKTSLLPETFNLKK